MVFLVSVVCVLLSSALGSLVVNVETDVTIQHVDPRFLSVAVDVYQLCRTPKLGDLHLDTKAERVRTLLRGLAPAYMRFGGQKTDFSIFSEDESITNCSKTNPNPIQAVMTRSDWDAFMDLSRSSGTRFLYQFNNQLRDGEQWDSSNAIATMEYLMSKGYTDVDFELGNEPDLYNRSSVRNAVNLHVLTGEQIARDYGLLRDTVAQYPAFNSSKIVGPDCAQTKPYYPLYTEFMKDGVQYLSAATFHHYYFSGKTATLEEYLNPDVFDELRKEITNALEPVRDSVIPDLPVWMGETGSGYSGGTPGVSDRFAAGFIWMDKLGLAAEMGMKVVVRQAFVGGSYGLVAKDSEMNPNPDYWLSHVYKQLVGEKVLKASVEGISVPKTVRVYAHCTKPSDRYQAGDVTIFAMNLDGNDDAQLELRSDLADKPIDQYLMTAPEAEGVLSLSVLLNGKKMEMVDDSTLPNLTPTTLAGGSNIALPPLSYGFFVISSADADACVDPGDGDPILI